MSYQEFLTYDKFERDHWWYRGRRKILRLFTQFIPLSFKNSLLEVGCGSGGNLCYLFDDFKLRKGLEIDSHALSFAKNKLANYAELSQGDANNIDKLSVRVDTVAFLDVLYHKNISDVSNVLAQTSKILNPQGYILICDGAFNFLSGSHSSSVNSARRFTRLELKKLLANNGFEIVKSSYWGFILFFLLFLKRRIIEKLFASNSLEQEKFDLLTVPVVDDILYASLYLESLFLKWFNIPLGASVVVLARKRKDD